MRATSLGRLDDDDDEDSGDEGDDEMTTNESSGLAVASNLPTTEVLDRIDRIAKIAAQSGLTTYRKTESASMILLTGRELGLGPMASLRGIHDVSGKPVLAADLMVAVVRRSGLCQKWRVVKSTVDYCEIVTRRVGEEEDESCVWTADDAKRAGCGGSTWQKFPRQMLSHRCAAELARRVYSDVLLGLYCPDELGGDGSGDVDEERPEPRATVIDAEVIALPRDNGRGPSSAVPATAPEDVAPVVVAPPLTVPLSDRDLRAMIDELRGAATLDALRASIHAMADDAERGTDAQRAEIRAAFAARKVELAPRTTPPDGDEPPPDGPRGRRKAPAKSPPADATSSAADGSPAPVDAPGAHASNGDPMTTRPERQAHLATLTEAFVVRRSWHRWRTMAPPHYREDCAERLRALDPMVSHALALAYLDASAPARIAAAQTKRVAA